MRRERPKSEPRCSAALILGVTRRTRNRGGWKSICAPTQDRYLARSLLSTACDSLFCLRLRIDFWLFLLVVKRPILCPEPGCDKSFIRQSHLKVGGQLTLFFRLAFFLFLDNFLFNLQRHLMSHRGERPFVCSHLECGLAFVTSTHLKRHLKVHEKPKPFEVSCICF